MNWLARHTGRTTPRLSSALLDLAVRALAPTVVLIGINIAIGKAITGPLANLPAEEAANRRLEAARSPGCDRIALATSWVSDPPRAVIGGLVTTALLQWRTGRAWRATLPLVGMALASLTHVSASLAVGRRRPDVTQLGTSHPTSSYPSGHVGAITAQWLVLGLLARQRPGRRAGAMAAACAIPPLVLGWSRLHLGQHYPSDVAMGYLNGLTCGALAWNYLREDAR